MIWDLSHNISQSISKIHSEGITTVAICDSDEIAITGSVDVTIKIWNYRAKTIEHTINLQSYVWSLAYDSLSKVICAGSHDCSIVYYSLPEKAILQVVKRGSAVYWIGLSKDRRYVVTADHLRIIVVWSCESKEIEFVMPGYTDSMKCIAVMSSHKFVVTGACDKTVRFWDLEGKKEAGVWFGHADFVISLGITPNDKYVVSCSLDRCIHVWSTGLPL